MFPFPVFGLPNAFEAGNPEESKKIYHYAKHYSCMYTVNSEEKSIEMKITDASVPKEWAGLSQTASYGIVSDILTLTGRKPLGGGDLAIEVWTRHKANNVQQLR